MFPNEFPNLPRARWEDPQGLTSQERKDFNKRMHDVSTQFAQKNKRYPNPAELERFSAQVLTEMGKAMPDVVKTEDVALVALELKPAHTDILPVFRHLLQTLQVADKDADDKPNPAYPLLKTAQEALIILIDDLVSAFRSRNALLALKEAYSMPDMDKAELHSYFRIKSEKREINKTLLESLKTFLKEVPGELSEEGKKALESIARPTSSQTSGENKPVEEGLMRSFRNIELQNESFYVATCATQLLDSAREKLDHRLAEISDLKETLKIPENLEPPKVRILNKNDQKFTIEEGIRLLCEMADTKQLLEVVLALNSLKGRYNGKFVKECTDAFNREFGWLEQKEREWNNACTTAIQALEKAYKEETPVELPPEDREKLTKAGGIEKFDQARKLSLARKNAAATQMALLKSLNKLMNDRMRGTLADRSTLGKLVSYVYEGSSGVEPLLKKLEVLNASLQTN